MGHGEVSHFEIPAEDTDRAKRFYGGVFGWSFNEMPGFEEYFLFECGPGGLGGAIGRRGVNTAARPLNYLGVDSIDPALAKVRELGGDVVTPRTEIPGTGWYAVIADSEGNEIGLFEGLPR